MSNVLLPHLCFPEPQLSFHRDRADDKHAHPLLGLAQFGPPSRGLVLDPIRVATITPESDTAHLTAFMKELQGPAPVSERKDYLPPWEGFERIFKVRVAAAEKKCRIVIDGAVDNEMKDSAKPHHVLSERLLRAIQALDAHRTNFDVLMLYLPDRWEAGFYGSADEDFDLHDQLKAVTAARGIPMQIVRESSAISYHCRASVMWRIGLALYAKAGGVPWTLSGADPEVAYIGISYAIRKLSDGSQQFVTCCSQVFDSDGSGLEFIAYDAREVTVDRDNPYLSRAEMFKVIGRSMDLYRRRHAGRSPRRVTVHKTTEFKKDEIDGCIAALPLCESIDLVQVVEDVAWKGVRCDRVSSGDLTAANFPIQRGTLLGLNGREALLWIHGSAAGITNRDYFQGARATPRPIKIVRHAGHGPWDETATSILALSKMNWNNDALYDPLPVTLGYSKVLARIIKRMPDLGMSAFPFRYFM